MDFIDELLPLLFFIAAAIFKAMGKSKQKEKKIMKKAEEQPVRRVEDRPFFPKTTHWGEMIKENLKKELDNMLDSDSSEVILKTKEELTETYDQTEKRKFETEPNIPRVKAREEIKDPIKRNEIGSTIGSFGRQQILDGIIMSEILSKPKALRR